MAGIESLRTDGERFTIRLVAGLALGFAGIVLLVWPDLTLTGAQGTRLPRRLRRAPARVPRLVDRLLLFPSSCARDERVQRDGGADDRRRPDDGDCGKAHGEWRLLHFTPRSTAAFVYLTTVGAIGGFASYTYALRHLPVSFVSLYAYINPIIAVALGVLLLGEPFNARMAGAAALVLLGVAVVKARASEREGEARARVRGSRTGRCVPPAHQASCVKWIDGASSSLG